MTRKDELLTLDQAAKFLSTSRATLYRWLREDKVQGMKIGRQWRFETEELERFLHGESPEIELPANPNPFLDALADLVEHPDPRSQDPLKDAFNLMIRLADERGASSLHLNPCFVDEQSKMVSWLRLRVEGILQPIVTLDNRLLAPLIAYWKKMAACYPKDSDLPQDGKIVLSTGKDRTLNVLVSFLPTNLGEALTARFLDFANYTRPLAELGLKQQDFKRIERALHRRGRMIVLSGPAGSDRDMILSSLLREVSGPGTNLMTLGCPPWLPLPWANSINLRNMGESRSYKAGIPTVLRSEPDTLGLGNLPNPETLDAVQQAVLKGVQVVAALNSEGAISTLRRLLELSESPLLLTQALELITSIRLPRKLCPDCARSCQPSKEQIEKVKRFFNLANPDSAPTSPTLREAIGCKSCGGSGYSKKTLIFETLSPSTNLLHMIARGASNDEVLKEAVDGGMNSLDSQTCGLALTGEISVEEAIRFLPL